MNIINKLYHSIVPCVVREPLWHLRTAVWMCIASREPATRRHHLANIRTGLGFSIATIPINGFRLQVDLRDEGVGRPIYVDRTYESAETACLQRILKPGMTFIDIGANIGYFTVLAAQLVGDSGKVLSFEPDPHNFAILCRNIAANGIRNVEAVNIALGPSEGEAFLYRSRSNFGDHRLVGDGTSREAIPIRVKSLDAILEEHGVGRVNVIKMDVQGYEQMIVNGMDKTLKEDDGLTLLMEFWPHGIESAGGCPSAFLDTFAAEGYVAALLNADGTTRDVRFEQVFDQLPEFDSSRPDHSFVNLVLYRRGLDRTYTA